MRLPQRITRVGAVAILLCRNRGPGSVRKFLVIRRFESAATCRGSSVAFGTTALSANGGPPGVMTIVQQGSQVYELAEGKADITTGQAMSGGATTRIASVSKPFSGAILLTLASQESWR